MNRRRNAGMRSALDTTDRDLDCSTVCLQDHTACRRRLMGLVPMLAERMALAQDLMGKRMNRRRNAGMRSALDTTDRNLNCSTVCLQDHTACRRRLMELVPIL